jgi:hypothetical protein
MTAQIIAFEGQPAFWRRRRDEERRKLLGVIDTIRERRDSRLLREHDRLRIALARISALPSELELLPDELRKTYQLAQEIAHEALYQAPPKSVA